MERKNKNKKEEDLSQGMKTAEFKTEIGNNFYGVDNFLSLFDCYKRTQEIFGVTLVLKEDKDKGIHIHEDETIKIVDMSVLKKMHNEMSSQFSSTNPWEKTEGKEIHSYLKHRIEDFFFTKKEREKLISDEQWGELLKAQKNPNTQEKN